jgi:hypothetical protein
VCLPIVVALAGSPGPVDGVKGTGAMRYDNLPEYPVRPGRSRDQRLKPQPSFGKLMGGMLGAFVAVGLVIHVLGGGSSGDGSRVAVKQGLPGGVVPAMQLVDQTSSSTTEAPLADTTVVDEPGTLPPTAPPTEAPATLAPTAASPAAKAAQAAVSATTAKPKATAAPAPATTAKPKATPAPAPATTAKPKATTVAPKPATTVAKPPPTTAKPKPVTTPAPPPPVLGTPAEVKAMIEQMWPADSVDKALAIAWRESNYRPEVYNGWCCYGVFQINASAHQRRLAAHGWITQDLFDPRVNITIALEIFDEQGWGPWGG